MALPSAGPVPALDAGHAGSARPANVVAAAPHDPALDAVRGAAAFAVVLVHTRLHWWPGKWAVDVFFVLSGFLITSRFLARPEPLSSFYGRRARRILPLYLVHVFLAVAIGLRPPEALVPLLLGLANVFPLPSEADPVPGGVLWSVAVEEHFYLLWPALLVWAPRTWWRWGLAMWASALLLRYGAAAADLDLRYTAKLTPLRWDGLVLGSLLGAATLRGVPATHLAAACLAGVALLAGVAVLVPTGPAGFALAYALIALGGAGVVLAARAAQPRSAVLEWLGLRCYGVYLLHPFAAHLVWGIEDPWLHTLATLGLTVVAADLSWRWLEQPAMRWRLPSRDARAP